MNKLKLKNALLFLFAALVSVSMFGCSSDDDENLPTDENDYKITVTVNNVNVDRDFISFVVVGGTHDQSNTLWKVNGEERNGEQGVSLIDADFAGSTKTYVIESVKPLILAKIGIQFINYAEPLSYAVKIEKNGTTEIDESSTLNGDNSTFTKDYTF